MKLPCELVEVRSSNLKAVGWHEGVLYVRFHSGRTWSYMEVPEEKYKAMLAAKSVGKLFASQIRLFHEAVMIEEDAEGDSHAKDSEAVRE